MNTLFNSTASFLKLLFSNPMKHKLEKDIEERLRDPKFCVDCGANLTKKEVIASYNPHTGAPNKRTQFHCYPCQSMAVINFLTWYMEPLEIPHKIRKQPIKTSKIHGTIRRAFV